PEVLAGEGVGGGDHVPAGPPAGQVVQRRVLPGELVRLVVGRLVGADQPEMPGHRRQGGQHGEGMRAANHVEVMDRAALLAQPEPFRQEEEVELAPLRGPRQVGERREVNLAARPGVAPHRVVVDPGEVRPEDDLLNRLAVTHWMPSVSRWTAYL